MQEALQGFFVFATYAEGAITPDQITGAGQSEFHFADTGSAEQYAQSYYRGAEHRVARILVRRDQVQADRSIVLYCDIGLLSSKAHMALKLLGYDENLKVMFGRYNNWNAKQGLHQPVE